MARVYLETSFFSACVSTRNDPASVARRNESQTWWTMQRKYHDLCVSAEVISELSNPAYPNASAALQLTSDLRQLTLDETVVGLAKILVKERVMPGPTGAGDALHVACSIVHRIEYILSWNVKHLANVNKMNHLKVICIRLGYVPPQIVTPDLLWREEDLEGAI